MTHNEPQTITPQAPDLSGLTISERLARFGITHEAGKALSMRYLMADGVCIGMADAIQATALAELLEETAGSSRDLGYDEGLASSGPVVALGEIDDLLQDWPTASLLEDIGDNRAEENRQKVREIIRKALKK